MCGRFSFNTEEAKIRIRFGIDLAGIPLPHNTDVRPTQRILAVVHGPKGRAPAFFQWGLIPHWAKDKDIGVKMINARAETVAERPSFRGPFSKQRCLIVADSFYEWKKNGAKKIPYRIRLKSHEPFAFAGLWDSWTGPDGKVIKSCTIITTEPNALLAPIHARMPVISTAEWENAWLDPAERDMKKLQGYLRPLDAALMEAEALEEFPPVLQ
ncbi:MAG: SOS response-associated peptidase [Planctomycetota bacterium]